MENIHKHMEHDKKIVDDAMASSQSRRHAEEELESLERYHSRHPEDEHDPTPLELYCDDNPDAIECKIFDV
jgi:hypothetical protein